LEIIILTLACFWEAAGGFWNTSYMHVLGIFDTLITQQKVNSLFARPPLASSKAVCQHSPAYVSTSAYVSIRQPLRETATCLQSANTSAYASIRQHTSVYVSIRQLCQHASASGKAVCQHPPAYVSIRGHVSIRQPTAKQPADAQQQHATSVCGLKLLVYEALSY
jgi:hypothetical protein